MRMPYETVSVTTAGKNHGFVWAPYATIVDSRNQTIGRRYNPEMIQIRKRVDWIFSELRLASDFSRSSATCPTSLSQDAWSKTKLGRVLPCRRRFHVGFRDVHLD